jgi:hypothetical protein
MKIARSDPDFYGRLLHQNKVFLDKMHNHMANCRTQLGEKVELAVDRAVHQHLSMSGFEDGEEDYFEDEDSA